MTNYWEPIFTELLFNAYVGEPTENTGLTEGVLVFCFGEFMNICYIELNLIGFWRCL